MAKIEIFKLEDRVLFEAAAVAEIVEAMDNDPNANMNETDRQAQEEKDAVKNAPAENPADAAYAQEGAKQPDEVADIDAEIQKLIDGEIAFNDAGAQAVDDAINGVFGDFGANAVEDAIHDAMRTEPVEMELYHSDEYITTDRELVVIDSNVPDADQIIGSLGANQEYLILDGNRDAMEQINEYLDASGAEYSGIHIVSHGNNDYFTLNGEIYNAGNFNGEDWSAIGEHLTSDGDILLYGCNLAENEAGKDFVAMIADASGADVAASVDRTGVSGNWVLEYNNGTIETANITVDNYAHNLTSFTVTNTDDSGVGSLREAIAEANLNPGEDLILFDPTINGQMITLESAITISDSLVIRGNGIANTIISGGNTNRIFVANADTKVEGLTLCNGVGDYGGAIFLGNDFTLEIGDNVKFADNTAGVGGAIYVYRGTVNVTGNDVLFDNNIANGGWLGGGAISGRVSSTVTVTGDRVVFQGNKVTGNHSGGGGAIFVNGTLTISGDDIKFIDNTATNYGGAILVQGDVSISGSAGHEASFSGNKIVEKTVLEADDRLGGGAIWAQKSLTIDYAVFENNDIVTNTGTERLGGAILSAGTTIINNSRFTNNGSSNVSYGGAIYVGGTYMNSILSTGSLTMDKCVFTGNSANSGGAVAVGGNGSYSLLGSSNISNSNFYSNSAVNGGAIYSQGNLTLKGGSFGDGTAANANTATSGGALYLYSSYTARTVNISGDTLFDTNTATGDGGAIWANSKITLNVGTDTAADGSAIFNTNSAANGGAIYSEGALIVKGATFGEDNVYDSGNSAVKGGAIYADGTLNLTDANFYYNKATQMGGAVYAGGTLTINGIGVFNNNSVETASGTEAWDVYGGAIYATGNLDITEDITFNNNYVYSNDGYNGYGGAIYVLGAAEITGAIFNYNRATYYNGYGYGAGGAIYAKGKLTLTDAEFGSNNAYDIGGAVYASGDVDIIGGKFEYNSTDDGQGQGGAIYIEQGGDSESMLTVKGGTEFTGNTAGSAGGAIYGSNAIINIGTADKADGSAVFFYNHVYSHNSAAGGAIYSNHTLNVQYAEFTSNYAKAIGNARTAQGGAIYANGTTSIHHTVFTRNYTTVEYSIPAFFSSFAATFDSISEGGAIYNTGNLTVHDTTFNNNFTAGGADYGYTMNRRGGAIYNTYGAVATVYNSTFYMNSAAGWYFYGNEATISNDEYVRRGNGYGGAIYNEGTLTVADTTLAANHALTDGGGIYNASGTAIVLNTLMIANTYYEATANGGDWDMVKKDQDFTIVDGSEFHMAYSIYGVMSGTITSDIFNVKTGSDALDNILGAEWDNDHLVFKGTSDDVLVDGTIAIKNTGLAAYKGTLVGQNGDHFYYRNMDTNKWDSFTDDTSTWVFDETDTVDFGLDGGDIIKYGQNYPASRIDIHFAYNVGAYVIELVPELPSVIVTTDSDVINPFDYEISLREAVEVYGGRTFSAGDYIDSITRRGVTVTAEFMVGSVITFNIIWGGESSIIELDSSKGSITFSNNLSIYGQNAADSNKRVTVKTASGASHRLFTADSSTANWDLGFYDLVLNGSSAFTGNGGIILINGRTMAVEVDNVDFSGGTAANGGAMHLNASAASTATIKNSTFTANTATSNGGALYISSNITSILSGTAANNLLFSDNIAKGTSYESGGGAIYNRGAMTINGYVTFSGNKAKADGEVNTSGNHHTRGGSGGGILTFGALTINGTDVQFNDNQAAGTGGSGGLYGGGAIYGRNSTIKLSGNITFSGNRADSEVSTKVGTVAKSRGGSGGAIFVYGGSLEINAGSADSVVFDNNQAWGMDGGGAIYLASAGMSILGTGEVLFKGNLAVDTSYMAQGNGGAIFANNNCGVTIRNTNTKFIGNIAYNYGGAIEIYGGHLYLYGQASNEIEFIGNMTMNGSSGRGGGGAIQIQQGQVVIEYCLFENNIVYKTSTSTSYESYGGAIQVWSNYQGNGWKTTISNSRFIGNVAQYGGAIYIGEKNATPYLGYGDVTITGCLFDGNRAANLVRTGSGYDPSGWTITQNWTIPSAGGAIALGTGTTSTSYALAGKLTLSGSNIFQNNSAESNNTTSGRTGGFGGAIYIGFNGSSTLYTGKVIFSDGSNTRFINNSATDGGAIYLTTNGVLTLGNATYYFEGNSASRNGGAIYFASGSAMTLTNMTFVNNKAVNSTATGGGSGGAIYTLRDLNLTGSMTFTGNQAWSNGGAVYASNVNLAISNIDFGSLIDPSLGNKALNGSGGAIYYSQTSASGTQNMSLNNVNFYYNSAYQNGGAIYYSNASTTDGTLTINGLNFSGNSTTGGVTSHGGAIYMAAGALLIADTGTVMSSFTGNSAAGNGGAIAMGSGTKLTASGGMLGRLAFRMNQAANGGAIAAENASVTLTGVDFGMDGSPIFGNQATSGSGGAIYFVQTSASGTENLSLNNVNFYGNSAYQNGGAIHYSNANGTLTADGLSFIGNSTTGGTTSHGGAIYVAAGGLIVQGSATKFEGNAAAGNGGAIAMNNGTTLSVTGITFLRNSANNGGAIYSSSGAAITGVTFGDGTLANANTARTNGGAIYLDGSTAKTVTIDGTTRFNYNTAVTAGGAIWVGGNTTLNIGAASFTLNQATARNSKGGAIYVADGTVNLTGTKFGTVDTASSGNSATFGGAVYVGGDSAVVAIDNVTFANNAAIEKGAINDPYWTETGMGGALYISGMAVVTIGGNSLFTQNTAGSHGGAIYMADYRSKLVISDTLFTQNVAKGNGGAIYSWATLELTRVNFGIKDVAGSGNHATGEYIPSITDNGFGGAIDSGGRIILVDCNFYRNTAKLDGGAILAGYDSNDRTTGIVTDAVTITGGEFGNAFEKDSGNHSLKQEGGAIYAGGGQVTTNNTNFYRNTAANNGGAIVGIWIHTTGGEFGHATEEGSGNIAYGKRGEDGMGGALYTWWEVISTGTGFYRNEAQNNNPIYEGYFGGGAIIGDQITVTDCEFGSLLSSTSGNKAIYGSGGAIYFTGKLISNNSNYYYNFAEDHGGAIAHWTEYSGGPATATITGGEFGNAGVKDSGNTAKLDGGAIYVARPDGTLLVESNGANYYYNTAGRDGGAIFCAYIHPHPNDPWYVWPDDYGPFNGASVEITGGEFGNASVLNSGNKAGHDGGAIFSGRLPDVNSITSTDANYYYNKAGHDGGAIYGYDNVDVTGNIFRYNNADNNGGAIYVVGSLTVDSSTFYTNSAVNDGGAIYGEGEITLNNSTKFGDKNTAGTGNTAVNGYGGAVYGKGTITANGTEFYRNQAKLDGGAIYGETKVVLESAVFGDKGITTSGNIANRDGGAVYAAGDVWANIVNAHHNRAGRDGGALYALTTGNVMLSNFTGNTSVYDGGAIYLAGTEVIMSNTLVADNTAGRNGGGIFSAATAATLINLTVANNNATGNGGGMWNTTAATIRNSIFWGNRAANMNQFNTGVANTVTHSGIEGWTLGGTGNIALQTANTGTNAKDEYYIWFKDADNADITKRNYNLASDSYAINRGNNNDAVLPHDLNFADRIQYGYVDMGAYETGSKGNIVISADDKTIIYGNTGTLVAHSDVSGSFTFTTADGKYIFLSGDQALALLADGQVTVNVEFISDDAANWNTATTTLTVTTVKRDITIAAKDATYDYDGQYHSLDWNDIIGGMGLAFDDFLDSYNSADHRNAGKYTYSLTDALIASLTRGNMSDNYNITYEAATLTINQVTLTITGESDNRTYDGAYHDYSYTENGLKGNDYIQSIVNGDNSWRNAGTYNNLQSGALIYNDLGEDVSGNYIINYVAGQVVINKATITVTRDGTDKEYDGNTDAQYTWKVEGVKGNDKVTYTEGDASFLDKNAGTNKTVVFSNDSLDADRNNYEVKYVDLGADITKATITVTRDGTDKEYDGNTDAQYTWKVEGVKGNDKVTYTEGDASFLDKNAGTNKTVVFSNDSLDADRNNYEVKYVDFGADITKATITVTRDGTDKEYDGNTDAQYTWKVEGVKGNDKVTYTEGTASFDDKNVGDNKNVNFIGDSLDVDLNNYDVVYVDFGADITPADLLIVIDDKGKVVGQADPAFTGKTTGLVGGDTVFGYNRTDKGETVGKYGIDQYQLEDGNGGKNYNVTVVNGTLTITAAVVDEARINIYSDASSRRYVINGQHQASLINSLSTMTANRDVDAVLDTENSGSVGSASHQTSAKAESKMKTNLKENSQKKSFEDYDQQVVQQRTNSMLVKSGLFADKAEKSVLDSQYKVNDKAGGVQVQMPVNDFSGAQNTSFQSDHPMHTMPSNINIEAGGINVVNFSGVELTDVTVMEKVENLKDALDLLLDEMLLV